MKVRTVSDLIVDTLQKAGVERMYGVPGDSLNGITEALRTRGAIEWVHMSAPICRPASRSPTMRQS